MRRRHFITLLGGAVAGPLLRPLAARAQQPAMPVIGFLNVSSPTSRAHDLAGFVQGLADVGYVEGRNVAVEYRWAEGQSARLPVLAADLVRRQVAVIVVMGAVGTVLAAKAATSTTPIVFQIGGDPVAYGLVKSLNRPAGIITGISLLNAELDSKRIGLLTELTPDATTIAYVVNPNSLTTGEKIERARAAASSLKRKIEILNARSASDFDDAFAIIAEHRIRAVAVTSDSFFNSQSSKIAALTNKYAVPVMSSNREVPTSGGLMSYGPSVKDAWRLAGTYAGRVLKGEKPADLPVLQPTRFEFVINLKTAKLLGLTVPPGVLAIADEVIE